MNSCGGCPPIFSQADRMLVLLTRALDEGLRTAAKLEAEGHRALLSPVLDMVPTGAEWPLGVIDAVLATSAQAFELLSAVPDWPLPEARRLLPLYLVGTRTLEAARERGFEGPAVLESDAKELAAWVKTFLSPPSRLLYLAGRDRKPNLEAELAVAGHEVETVEVYTAQAADFLSDEALAAIETGEIGAVLHYSRRSAAIFLDLMQAAQVDAAHLTHVAISQDAAMPLWERNCKEVHVAEKPNEQAMLAVVGTLASLTKTLFAQRDPAP
jgi:uroporphyrinogen-III synthase